MVKDIAYEIGLPRPKSLYGIENGKLQTGIRFKDYLAYTNVLGISLRYLYCPIGWKETYPGIDCLTFKKEQPKLIPAEARRQEAKRRFEQRQDELVEKIETAIEWLKAEGKRPSQIQISKIVGLSVSGLKYYPEIKFILEQVKQNYRRKKP